MIRQVLSLLEPESAHRAAIRLAALLPAGHADAVAGLETRLAGLDLPVPIGLAAGFDKNAEAFDGLGRLGFGFVEIGTVTPRPQAGNPRPRLFRLAEDGAIINRMGFNNAGLDAVAARLERRRGHGPVLGANVGANKDSADPIADYRTCVQRLHDLVDYLVLNVSSPNTPGLRQLQKQDALTRLVAEVRAARDQAGQRSRARPFFVKIAPDLGEDDQDAIARVVVDEGADGLIVSNTTIERPASLRSAARGETGGLSGAPLFAPATALLAAMFRRLDGRLPLIGVGGIGSAETALAKFLAGASAVQLYSGLVTAGPGLPRTIARQLPSLLRAQGATHIRDLIGRDAHPGR